MRRFAVVRAYLAPAGLAALAETACVVGAERPPTRLELAQLPSEPGSRDAAGLTARRGCAPVPPHARTPRPGEMPAEAVWIDGYCHSTSVGYEWVPGHWEARPPPRTWK